MSRCRPRTLPTRGVATLLSIAGAVGDGAATGYVVAFGTAAVIAAGYAGFLLLGRTRTPDGATTEE
jgi:hypothetical protein